MSSMWSNNLQLSLFGQSHSKAVGICLHGLPAGLTVDLEVLQAFLDRRTPGYQETSTARKEPDAVHFLSGVVNGVTCGAPLAALIYNTDTRADDYRVIQSSPRPSHSDFSARMKYDGAEDTRGGGHFSGRLTAALCLAGGLCLQFLAREHILVGAHIAAVGSIRDDVFDPVKVNAADLMALKQAAFPVINQTQGEAMRAAILEAKKAGDSLGGMVECAVVGVPAGLGEPVFAGMENQISSLVFAIPAVKGLEFGNGFAAAALHGSENNDVFFQEGDKIYTRTNRHGGILGGLTSGMPLLFRAAIKPTPSIGVPQNTINYAGKPCCLEIPGRHDPCIVPRAVPCIESAAAIAVYDAVLGARISGRGA